MSQKSAFEKGMESLEAVRQKINELQQQLILQKGINKIQKQQLEQVKDYAEQLRYGNTSTISYSLRKILNLKDCPECARLLDNCICKRFSN